MNALSFPGTHPWKRRTPSDVRDLCARAAQPKPQPPAARTPRAALFAPLPLARIGTTGPPPVP